MSQLWISRVVSRSRFNVTRSATSSPSRTSRMAPAQNRMPLVSKWKSLRSTRRAHAPPSRSPFDQSLGGLASRTANLTEARNSDRESQLCLLGPFSGSRTTRASCPQRLTVTRRKVAAIEVPPSVLVFCDLTSSTSSACSSTTFPFFSAASKAFIVGP